MPDDNKATAALENLTPAAQGLAMAIESINRVQRMMSAYPPMPPLPDCPPRYTGWRRRWWHFKAALLP